MTSDFEIDRRICRISDFLKVAAKYTAKSGIGFAEFYTSKEIFRNRVNVGAKILVRFCLDYVQHFI
jgi:hypothetical protein